MPGKRSAPRPPEAASDVDHVEDGANYGRRVTRGNLKRSASAASLAPSRGRRQAQLQRHTPPRQYNRQHTEPNLELGKRPTAKWTSTTLKSVDRTYVKPSSMGAETADQQASARNTNPQPSTPPHGSAGVPSGATPRPATPSRIPVSATPSRIPVPATPKGTGTRAGNGAARFRKLQELAKAEAAASYQPQSPVLKSVPKVSAPAASVGTPTQKRKAEDAHATYVKDDTRTAPTRKEVPVPQSKNSKKRAPGYLPWVDRHIPLSSSSGHFVNPRKISEVGNWLLHAGEGEARILLMVGPSGSGKTATICTLAKENRFVIREWVNPVQVLDSVWGSESYASEDREIWFTGRSQNQVDQFAEFLLRASTYNTLPMPYTAEDQSPKPSKSSARLRPVVLVEDLPNIFYKKPEVLHEIIRNYRVLGGCPLVFIIPESTSSATGQHRLFPPSLMTELGVRQVSFNKVAPTFIVSYLGGICAAEKLVHVEKELLEEIALTADGDMRWAINNLEFRLHGTQDDFRKPLFIPPAKKRKGETMKAKKAAAAARNAAGENDYLRDESIFLFHALGKVLYGKRDLAVQNPVEDELIGSSMEWARRANPLLENPDSIGERVQVSPQTFFNFLGQNYLSFFTSIEETARASEHLADAAEILTHWTADDSGKMNEMKEQMGLSIAIRGLMHVNEQRPTSSFRQLRKPQFTDANSQLMNTIQSLQTAFGNHGPICQDFYANELPFYRKLNANKFDTSQSKLIKQVGMIDNLQQSQRRTEILQDKAVVDDDTDVIPEFAEVELNDADGKPKPVPKGFMVKEEKLVTPVSSPNEYVIEDYDDE